MATRNERVVLDLVDNFSSGMAKAAAQTAMLDRSLKSLDGSQVGANRSAVDLGKSLPKIGDGAEQSSRKVEKVGAEIDKLSGRVRLFADAALTIGPALVPIGAAAIPAIAGLAAGLGAAAGAAGVAALAFSGLGDAMDAVDKYQLDGSTENLRKMTDELERLGPMGATFVLYLDSLEPTLKRLQNTAREGLFPGIEDGIDSLLTMLPQVTQIVDNLGTEMGNLARDAGEGLSGEGFARFFDYIQGSGAAVLSDFANTLGNVTEGFANMLVAFGPLTSQFSGGMESMTASFAKWAAGLGESDGFRAFVSYVQQTSPQVIDLIGSMSNAFVSIVTAAAPVGAVVVPILSALADVMTVVANSPIGPPLIAGAAALVAMSRAATIAQAGMARFQASSLAMTGSLTGMQRAAGLAVAALAGLAVVDAIQDKTDTAGLSMQKMTASLLDLQSAGAGDLPDNLNGLGDSIDRLADPNKAQALQDNISDALGGIGGGSELKEARAQIEGLDQALAGLVTQQGPAEAAASLNKLAASAGLSKGELADLQNLLPSYNEALTSASNAARTSAVSVDTYQGALGRAGIAAGITEAAVDQMANAMREGAKAAIGAFDAQTRYAESLEAARNAAKGNSAGIRTSTEAGRRNRDMLSGLAAAWNGQSDAVKNANGKFKEARSAFIQTATAMGVPKKAAIDLANRLMEIPEKRVINIAMTGDQAAAGRLAAIRKAVTDIPLTWSTTYYVNQVNRISKPAALPGSPAGDYADGGFTGPGRKYDVAGVVHRGEVVIPQERVKRDWSMLKARYGDLPGFAGGGMVSADPRRTDARGGGLPFGMDVDLPRGMGILGQTVKETGKHLRDVNKHLKLTKKQLLEEAEARKKGLLDRRNSIKSGISGGLMTDIWAAPSNPWSAGASANPTDALKEITANARKFSALIKSLKGKGVKGAALAEIISSGDVQRAELMNSLSAADLKGFTSALAQARGAVASAASLGGQAVIPQKELREITREIRRLRNDVKHADKNNQKGHKDGPRAMGVVINDAAKGGRRRARR